MNIVSRFKEMMPQLILFIIKICICINACQFICLAQSHDHFINLCNICIPTWARSAQKYFTVWIWVFDRCRIYVAFYQYQNYCDSLNNNAIKNSGETENTLKSMGKLILWKYFWSLTVSWVYGVDRKIHHSGSMFSITRLASSRVTDDSKPSDAEQ